MKKYKSLFYTLVIIIMSNLPPLNFFFRVFGGDSIVRGSNESLYVTQDLKYIYGGKIGDTLKNDCYRQYRAKYPMSNSTLYRLQPLVLWKFWNWGEYLTNEKWRQPYTHVSDKDLKEAMFVFSKTYDSPNGTLDCETYPSR
ncbi:hypothetical protein [Runella slithyformis]|uniref:Uncharacterized protein n=1 Tax=Runella slithyformis (strain ATCC 29530 / DSM 19594 / LMG 11500 / NCIMB 11436 / LSU 4) TaxID=761193 RepID=A0A7U3ZMJ0_RUNSL|nr:hypothetical protein [Runella slithyformis]AEI49954.1 hypothetical protein Runsl_3593 [Runella slithyformis DSM 19594]